jgi:outer membrane protein assembly factor BamA
VSRQALVFASCSLGILFLCGFRFECLAQSPLAPVTHPVAKDEEAKRCLESTCRNAPVREQLSAIHLGTKYMRGIVGGFEQGAGIGGGVQLTSADALPSLELRATALTSSRFYRRFDLEGYVPNIGGSRNHADMWFSYMRRETDFFGIGPRVSRDLKTNFATEQRSYQGSLYRDIANHFQGGVFTQVTNSHSSRGKINTDTPIDESFSSTPNQPVASWIPGFLSNAKILSYGGFLEYDTRDNTAGLTRGLNFYGRVASDDGLDNHAAFADYGWIEGEFDVRGYVPLGGPGTSLALRSKGEFKKTKGGSQIPFYDLSWLGGREYVRGYELYRFRGNNALLFSTELRQTVYSKTDSRGVDVFGFADSGQVWGDARPATDPLIRATRNFSSSNWHSGVGGGVQYRHSQSLAARLEVGRSNEGALIYVSMSRGF